ncbi:MAG: hypothetical protein ABIO91_03330 [Pyrinomonadaceae bacterium]
MSKTGKSERAEYDFSGGVRGKHAARLKNGHKTVITNAGRSIETRITRPVVLDPDVQSVFKNSKEVNKALRRLIGNRAPK